MALHDPVRYAGIVRGMIDIQKNEGCYMLTVKVHDRKTDISLGWLPECRGATDQQWIQGGSSKFVNNFRFGSRR